MFRISLALGVCLVVAVSASAQNSSQAKKASSSLDSQKGRASYSIGVNVGRDFKRRGFQLDVELLIQGLRDAATGSKLKLTDEQMATALRVFQDQMVKQQNDRQRQVAEKNKREGQAFLAANAKKPGVKTLPSGLQYKVLRAGTGASPKLTDKVTTHYEGKLINGTVFDSSIKRGEPASFPVNGVIKGWTEALQLMKVGSKWQLFVPSDLAYGTRGAGARIGPNATLIFEVELLKIN